MKNAETLYIETLLSEEMRRLPGLDERNRNFFEKTQVASINNHLKTVAEIDAELISQITINRAATEESSDELNTHESILKNGGKTVSPTSLYHGFMEENY